MVQRHNVLEPHYVDDKWTACRSLWLLAGAFWKTSKKPRTCMECMENRITVNLDTYYLDWKNTFPAVSVCMMEPHDWKMKSKFVAYMDSYLRDNGVESLRYNSLIPIIYFPNQK